MEQVVEVDVRKLEEAGYMVQRRYFWQYAVVSQSGKNVLEAIILPDAVVISNEDEFLCGRKATLTVEDSVPLALLQP